MNNKQQPKTLKDNIKLPLLGAAYYPEAWDESEQEKDIAQMQKAGIKVVRIAEFARYKMEPKESEFHFEWLHRVINKLTARLTPILRNLLLIRP